MTIQEFATQFRIDYPTLTENTNGQDVVLGPEAYESRIQEMAVAAYNQQQEELAVVAQQQLARDVQTALTLLDGTATLAQVRVILARLIRYLLQQGVIDIG